MPENKGHTGNNAESAARAATGENASSGDLLGLRDVLTISGGTVDACNVTSSLQFRFDSATGNTLVDVTSPGGANAPDMHTQRIVLPGIDLTSHGSLSDSQVIQLLLSQGRLSTEI
ncbi:MAG: type I secretion C-terminal target domain-containing protein [Burkholderiales bacterium]